jgi:hypothetical protein
LKGARREYIHDTYKDVIRDQDLMARGWITAILSEESASPSFLDGARIQRILDTALLSNRDKRWVEIAEIKA